MSTSIANSIRQRASNDTAQRRRLRLLTALAIVAALLVGPRAFAAGTEDVPQARSSPHALTILRALACTGKSATESAAAGLPQFAPVTLNDIFQTYREIGALAGCEARAHAYVLEISRRLAGMSASVLKRPRPRVALILGLAPIVAPGGDSFVTDVIEIAGGETVLEDIVVAPRTLTPEALAARQPQIVILTERQPADAAQREALQRQWQALGVDAPLLLLPQQLIENWADLPAAVSTLQQLLFAQ